MKPHQFPKTGLRLLVDGVYPLIHCLLLLLEHFRVGTLLKTLEDLRKQRKAVSNHKSKRVLINSKRCNIRLHLRRKVGKTLLRLQWPATHLEGFLGYLRLSRKLRWRLHFGTWPAVLLRFTHPTTQWLSIIITLLIRQTLRSLQTVLACLHFIVFRGISPESPHLKLGPELGRIQSLWKDGDKSSLQTGESGNLNSTRAVTDHYTAYSWISEHTKKPTTLYNRSSIRVQHSWVRCRSCLPLFLPSRHWYRI